MSLDLQKISPNLKDILLNLKHMSPMQRFAEVSRPRLELNWKTVAAEYGVEKLEKNQWLIPDAEIFGVAAQTAPIHEPGIAVQPVATSKHRLAAETASLAYRTGDAEEEIMPTPRRADPAEELALSQRRNDRAEE